MWWYCELGWKMTAWKDDQQWLASRYNWNTEGASLWNPWKWNSKAFWELEVAWEVHRVFGTQIWHGNKWDMIFSSPWCKQEVQTNSSAYRLDGAFSSDWNVLQGGDHVSAEKHGVRGCWSLEHKCVQEGVIDHQDWGSNWGLTDYWGVLQRWDPLRVEFRRQSGAFQHP